MNKKSNLQLQVSIIYFNELAIVVTEAPPAAQKSQESIVPKKTVKFVEVISDSSTDAFEDDGKKMEQGKAKLALLAVPSKKPEKKKRGTEKRGGTVTVVSKSKKEGSQRVGSANVERFQENEAIGLIQVL